MKKFSLFVVLLAFSIFRFDESAVALANNATPSHVYQSVSTLNNQLALMHKYNESSPGELVEPDLQRALKPRHVFQNARMVYRKVQILRQINGLEAKSPPQMPESEITPGNVKNIVDMILADTLELNEIFGVGERMSDASFVDGKKPANVYAALLVASKQVDALDLPKVIPNDVYQVALEVVEAVNRLVTAQGGQPAEVRFVSSGKSPRNVIDATYATLELLQQKAEGVMQAEIPGGFVYDQPKGGKITPADVIYMMNQLLGELHSTMVSKGIDPRIPTMQPQAGKTPSHVFDAIVTAQNALETIR